MSDQFSLSTAAQAQVRMYYFLVQIPKEPISVLKTQNIILTCYLQAASRMYFNSQFFPQFSAQGGVAGMMGGSGALASHGPANNSMQHSMNMLYMDSLQRQEHCSSGQFGLGVKCED